MKIPSTLWFISGDFYPDEIGVAYFMTQLALHFAPSRRVAVLCGLPKYNARGRAVPRLEIWKGVRVERCRDSTLDKNRMFQRILMVFVSSFSIFGRALRRFRRGDTVLVVTSPPLLPFLVRIACAVRGARCLLRVDDVYPEVFVAAGNMAPRSLAVKVLVGLNKRLYRSMERIVVLGRDMEALARAKAGPRFSKKIIVIPNYADLDLVRPEPKASNPLLKELGLTGKFVVHNAGNVGRAQAIETMIGAAERLRDRGDIHFLFIGAGAKRGWMESEVRAKALTNVTLLGERPRTEQNVFLNACDITMVSLRSGMAGAGVPSRMYNVMAAGKPILAVVEDHSELARVVREEDIGWVVSPDDSARVAEAVVRAALDPQTVAAMGFRARKAVEAKYHPGRSLTEYERLFG